MANRRMFALTIVDSDSFLDMPPSTQNLYFHLGMRADDDGFVNNPKTITRYIGSKDDDLKLLEAKKFIISFPSGVIVLKHWKINNYLQSDRITPTKYQKERSELVLTKNSSYSPKNNEDMETKTPCIQNVYKMYTQCSIDENSIDKISIGESESKGAHAHATQNDFVKRTFGRYKNVKLTEEQYTQLQSLHPTNYQEYIDRLDKFIGKSGRSYDNHFVVIDSWIIEDKSKSNNNSPTINSEPKTIQNDEDDVMTEEEYKKLLDELNNKNNISKNNMEAIS